LRNEKVEKNEKVEQHIRKKIHKPNALRFKLKVVSLSYVNLVQIIQQH